MIPIRLTLKNFMCYRDNVPTLDLEGIHVACLCGDNGHGKTALLDAMTWVLWGESRARTQDELVHQGQQDMAVDLEFIARDQRYRVSRRHSRSARSRQGSTLLELQVSSDNGYSPITGNTVRDTEARIREILHMDYDTFVNTAFLLQGQADLFTRSSPSKRKEVLAEVLDLSYYEKLEGSAKDKSKSLQGEILAADSAVALRREEIARLPEWERKLATVEETLARIAPEVVATEHKVDKLRSAVDSLEGQRAEIERLQHRLEASRSEIAGLERQARSSEEKIAGYETLMSRAQEVGEQFTRLEELRSELGRLDDASFRYLKLDREKAEHQKAIAVHHERLSGQIVQMRQRIAEELEPWAKKVPEIEESLRGAAVELGSLDELEERIRNQRDEAQAIAAKVRYLEEASTALKSEMESTRKKFDLLDEGDALCPLCRQPLGSEGKEHLRRENEALGQRAKAEYQENASEHARLSELHESLVAQVSTQEKDLGGKRQKHQNRVAALERDLKDSRRAGQQLRPATSELEGLERLQANGDYASVERRRLAELEAELEGLGYAQGVHKRVQEQVKSLEPYPELRRKLLDAQEGLPVEREALKTARQLIDRRLQEARHDEERLEGLARDLESLPVLKVELERAQSSHEKIAKQHGDALVEQGIAKEQLERLTIIGAELRDLEQRRRKLVEEKGVYDELATAFGKNGIQALIIETAIPQLQDDANEMLGRLTDYRLSLKLQLQEGRKDRRSGLPSEELQVLIGDEVGTRSYETFSGGETFRVNFALRIALSKLLASRSGAPLPTLFIDEGFGSQDSAGQERLKEAIQSIQSDFEKIIVITHVEQVKESFPTRIEVTKTPSGSTFVVV